MTKKPILSICIPTYNREKYIKILLDSIVSQSGFTDEVEIVIDDGPSKDETEHLVRQYQKKYSNIRYFRNPKAIGMLPAIMEAISLSNGTYTWLFSSDDFMHHDALEITLDAIKKTAPTLILSNRFAFNKIEECTNILQQKTKRIDRVFDGFSDFGSYLGLDEPEKYIDKVNYLTFMSVFCFNTEYYTEMLEFTKKSICSLEDLHKHYFNYIVILFSQLSVDKKIYLIESPRLVFCQGGNSGWTTNKKIADDLKMLIKYVKNYYPLSKKCIKFLNLVSISNLFISTIVHQLSKIKFFWKIINFLMKNKRTRNFYYKILNIFT